MPDLYSGQAGINIGPFGCAINFSLSPALPTPGGVPVPGEHVATVRMSLEHMKILTFLLHRQLLQYEQGMGAVIPIPRPLLNQLQVGREDWDAFWGAR
jgi:hypothetical protein